MANIQFTNDNNESITPEAEQQYILTKDALQALAAATYTNAPMQYIQASNVTASTFNNNIYYTYDEINREYVRATAFNSDPEVIYYIKLSKNTDVNGESWVSGAKYITVYKGNGEKTVFPVGSEITFKNSDGSNVDVVASGDQNTGTFRVAIDGITYEVGIKGFEGVTIDTEVTENGPGLIKSGAVNTAITTALNNLISDISAYYQKKITSGINDPSGGADGDIYLQYTL